MSGICKGHSKAGGGIRVFPARDGYRAAQEGRSCTIWMGEISESPLMAVVSYGILITLNTFTSFTQNHRAIRVGGICC